MAKTPWFDVDKQGLAKLLSDRPKSFILYELYQNGWDEPIDQITASIRQIPKRQVVEIIVEDDSPDGFCDLKHAFTLFAESVKKGDPNKRGRFNMGEKEALACCIKARIESTTGTVIFNEDGSRTKSKKGTKVGSRFIAELKMTRKEFDQVCQDVKKLIPPTGIKTMFIYNETKIELKQRKPVATFKAQLPTLISDKDGNLKRSARRTTVNVYEPKKGEKASVYEMGIPVVETGDKYHIDIQQKVPQNMNRDNVTPAYLRTIRTLVLNHTANLLSKDEATSTWVNEATSDTRCEDDAINATMDLRFGKKRVSHDPSDTEANGIAMSKGYTVIAGRSLNKDQWKNLKRSGGVMPAGKVTPSPKPYGNGRSKKQVPEEKWTEGMHNVVRYSKMIAKKLLGVNIKVEIINDRDVYAIATYGPSGTLTFNLQKIGKRFFDNFPTNVSRVDELLIHEFGHQFSSDHLSSDYHEALSGLGAKLKQLALDEPELFTLEALTKEMAIVS